MASPRSTRAAPPIPQNSESVPHDFVCSVCHELSTEPVLTPCDHIFCLGCIRESLRHREECPIDRRPLDEDDLLGSALSGVLLRVYEGIAVRCPREPCSWTGVVGNYAAHLQRCEHSVDPEIVAGLRQKIRAQELLLQERDEIIQAQEGMIQKLEESTRKKKQVLAIAKSEIHESKDTIEQLTEQIRTLKLNSVTVDEGYKYDRTRVKELSLLICKYLENKPGNIDRNRIYNCVKACYDDFCKDWGDNPECYGIDMRMLINICLASTWFSTKQHKNLLDWAECVH